ncbi:MAG: hypothetical protein NTV50_03250 [Planctomycetota bacterium]|nr:hypothetical protein [Planctomycetota bacterium]
MKLSVAAFLLLLLAGIGYSSYSYVKNAPMREFDAAVAGVDIEKIADMEVEERKTFFETMKTIRDKMSDSQKKSNDDKNAQRMNEQFKEKFNRFFSSSPEEQRKALDKDIDRMANMMKGFMSGKGGFGPPGMGGPGMGFKSADTTAKKTPPPSGASLGKNATTSGTGGSATGAGNSANANGASGSNTANANAGGGVNPASGAANASNTSGTANTASAKSKGTPSPEERNKRLSDGLDKSTPEMRAQMTEYWVRMNQRVKERGVQMIPFLGGFGGPKPK